MDRTTRAAFKYYQELNERVLAQLDDAPLEFKMVSVHQAGELVTILWEGSVVWDSVQCCCELETDSPSNSDIRASIWKALSEHVGSVLRCARLMGITPVGAAGGEEEG